MALNHPLAQVKGLGTQGRGKMSGSRVLGLVPGRGVPVEYLCVLEKGLLGGRVLALGLWGEVNTWKCRAQGVLYSET